MAQSYELIYEWLVWVLVLVCTGSVYAVPLFLVTVRTSVSTVPISYRFCMPVIIYNTLVMIYFDDLSSITIVSNETTANTRLPKINTISCGNSIANR